ncbi:MAG TPA: pyridoxamine 5'-phosphate oxidase family protein [Acidimicrobiales bacterium]|nr:pyridoxamine 5'-phosphate oxidase family protein [Acidimicrobiales bacterium]
MARWKDFAAAEPDFSRRVLTLFETQKHMTLATLRRDGSPRISGTEAHLVDGELVLGMMSGSLKARDLLRDPRLALHSPALDPPEGDPSGWSGDAKIAGVGVESLDKNPDDDPDDESHRFFIDINEVVLTKVGTPADHLVIESWRPGSGLRRRQRK